MELVLTECEWMLLELLIEADRTLFACAVAVREAVTDPMDRETLPPLPDPLIRKQTLAALMTLSQVGFIELRRGPLAVRPDGSLGAGRTRVVPQPEAHRFMQDTRSWQSHYGVRTRVALVVAPTMEGMRYAGLAYPLEA